MADFNVSGTTNPYVVAKYTPQKNSKNTLEITDYIKLLAVQLQNQDMTDPMDSSEMMNQFTQMAMVQALSTMTESVTANSATNTTIYAASMVGKEVTVAVTEEDPVYGVDILVGSKTGIVESINLTGSTPTFRLQGDSKNYPLSYLMGIGDVTDQIKKNGDESGEDLT